MKIHYAMFQVYQKTGNHQKLSSIRQMLQEYHEQQQVSSYLNHSFIHICLFQPVEVSVSEDGVQIPLSDLILSVTVSDDPVSNWVAGGWWPEQF